MRNKIFLKGMVIALLFNILCKSDPSYADNEASQKSYIVIGEGYPPPCYARSIYQANLEGKTDARKKGVTQVYRLINSLEGDELITTYDWFSSQIHMFCNNFDITVVRMGPWPRGQKANHDDLAFSFYKEGKLLKRYSTLDIAETEENVSRTLSHYNVIKGDPKTMEISNAEHRGWWGFKVQTIDDRILEFDINTGELVE